MAAPALSMLGAMRLRLSLVAIITCFALTACGGSSHKSSSQAAGTPAASSSPTTASSTTGSAGQTDTFSVSGEGPAVTTTTSTSAPPEVPKAKKRTHHGSTHAASQGAHVETNVSIAANGDVSPPVVAVPSGVGVELHVANHGSTAGTVVLSVQGRPSVKVAAGGHGTLQTGGLKNGTYRILVNGTPRGQLMIGAQGGP